MRYIDGTVRGGRIVLSDTVVGAATSHDHCSLRLTLDGEWIGLELTAQFIDAHGSACYALCEREQDGTLLLPIPLGATRHAGTAHFTLRGIAVDNDTETVAVATAECDLTVLPSGWDAEAEEIAQPDATLAAQLQTQIATKQNAQDGKGLSTNDFTDADKAKLHTHAAGSVDVSAAQVAAWNGKLADAVAIGPSETEESIVDANGVAHIPMIVSRTSEKRPGMVRTWAKRYATAATNAGVLVALPKTATQFYEQLDGEDVLHENAVVAKGTLLHLMGSPDRGAMIATKQELSDGRMHYIKTAVVSSPTKTLTVPLDRPLSEVFCFVTVIGSADASGNVAFRFKNGTQMASRTIGTLTANATKKGMVKFTTYGGCPNINIIERVTLSATAGVDGAVNEYVYSGGITSGEVTSVELALSSGSGTFAVGTKIDICGVVA